MALGFVTAGVLSGRPLFQGAYPITPASDLLHHLAKYKHLNVMTFQAEDENCCHLCDHWCCLWWCDWCDIILWSWNRPKKGEALGLGIITEAMVVVDIQRGGPSTGLPTKTEQSDLNIAMFGRHGEAPMPVIAAQSPSDCFSAAVEAVRVAVKYRMPVMLLSDGYIANGSEPWKIPSIDSMKAIDPNFEESKEDFLPYSRDPETLARPWAIPWNTWTGTPKIGGLEKQEGSKCIL